MENESGNDNDFGLAEDLDSELAQLETQALAFQPAEAAGADPADDVSYSELFGLLLRPTADLLLPAWEITDAEVSKLAGVYGALADKYFPDGSQFGVEISAFLVTVMVIAPRIQANTPRKLPEPESPADA